MYCYKFLDSIIYFISRSEEQRAHTLHPGKIDTPKHKSSWVALFFVMLTFPRTKDISKVVTVCYSIYLFNYYLCYSSYHHGVEMGHSKIDSI